ncbi:MAG: YceD family protein, partial [Chitinophagaceae bacterium]
MPGHREYDIAFVGLKPGIHEFNYDIDDKFFTEYPEQDFSKVHTKVHLKLEKNTNFMMLKFGIGGSVEVSCDRCGNPLGQDLWDEFEVLVKLVDEPEKMNEEEEDPDVFYISKGESLLNVEEWIYEFIE